MLVSHFPLTMLLHEFGHGVHHLVSRTRYARFHGPAGTPVDLGEAPSQMLENWCWDAGLLKRMSVALFLSVW
jgi:metallopeptidase MepB